MELEKLTMILQYCQSLFNKGIVETKEINELINEAMELLEELELMEQYTYINNNNNCYFESENEAIIDNMEIVLESC